MCYKIVHGLVSFDCSDFFSFANFDRTRGHVRKFSFAGRVCPMWNRLPYEIVMLPVLVLLHANLILSNWIVNLFFDLFVNMLDHCVVNFVLCFRPHVSVLHGPGPVCPVGALVACL